MTSRHRASSLVNAALAWVREHRVDGEAQGASRTTPSDMTEDTDLLTSGILDSLGFLELFTFLQRQSGRTVDLSDIDPDVFSTLSGLCGAFSADDGIEHEH
jgi:acyl carrier protein